MSVQLFVDGKPVDFTQVKLVYSERATESFGSKIPAGRLEITLTQSLVTKKAYAKRRLVREESDKYDSELDRMISWG